jgi:hypothetical protein
VLAAFVFRLFIEESVIMPRSFCGFLVCASLLLAGCGGGTGVKTYPVKGTVTYRGQPLPDAAVTFYPSQGRHAAGLTDAQGTFFLSTFNPKDGAPAGTYQVGITEAVLETPPMPGTGGPELQPKPPRFPARYTDPNQSTLTAEVKPDGENDFKFDLTE